MGRTFVKCLDALEAEDHAVGLARREPWTSLVMIREPSKLGRSWHHHPEFPTHSEIAEAPDEHRVKRRKIHRCSLSEVMSHGVAWRSCARAPSEQSYLQLPRRFALQSVAPRARLRVLPQCRAIHYDGPKQPNPLVNPPSSTRPPPLTLPRRNEVESTPQYYLQLGKGYLQFYKSGFKALFANRRLLNEKIQRTPADARPSVFRPHYVPETFSRADWVLFWRVRHDWLRLPLFGLMLIVFGEFTPIVVIYADGAVPFTCRVPRQVFSALEKGEQRRSQSFSELDAQHPHGVLSPGIIQGIARAHVLRSLHLSGSIWDRVLPSGVSPPGMWYLKGRLRMAFLEGDDKNLVEDGGPSGLEYEELRIACAERGIDVLGKGEAELKGRLGDWLRLTSSEDVDERRRRMAVLLMTRPEQWPQARDFALPAWEL